MWKVISWPSITVSGPVAGQNLVYGGSVAGWTASGSYISTNTVSSPNICIDDDSMKELLEKHADQVIDTLLDSPNFIDKLLNDRRVLDKIHEEIERHARREEGL